MAGKSKIDQWLSEDALILIEGWARDGLTQEQIAHNMGVSENTLITWKKRSPLIFEALKKGKEVVDRIVENALFKRACGYDWTETTTVRTFDKTGKQTGESVKEVTKHVSPDTTAQIFWLKNRKPEEWRDRKDQPPEKEYESDGFLEAIENKAEEVWKDEEETGAV